MSYYQENRKCNILYPEGFPVVENLNEQLYLECYKAQSLETPYMNAK